MSLRARILIFLLALLVCAALPLASPWPLVIACVVYLVVVFPVIDR